MSLTLIALISVFLLIRPAEAVSFESVDEGKEAVEVNTTGRFGTVMMTISEKRINQELAESMQQTEAPNVKIQGTRLDLKENLIVYKSNLTYYNRPIGFEMEMVPVFKEGKIYLDVKSARLGKIKVPPGTLVKYMAKSLPEENLLKYDEKLNQLYVDPSVGSEKLEIKDFKVLEDKAVVEMAVNI